MTWTLREYSNEIMPLRGQPTILEQNRSRLRKLKVRDLSIRERYPNYRRYRTWSTFKPPILTPKTLPRYSERIPPSITRHILICLCSGECTGYLKLRPTTALSMDRPHELAAKQPS